MKFGTCLEFSLWEPLEAKGLISLLLIRTSYHVIKTANVLRWRCVSLGAGTQQEASDTCRY